MRAIIIATGNADTDQLSPTRWHAPLVTTLDRPFVQHVVEYIASQGFDTVDFVLCDQAQATEALLEDGRRWGCTFRFHLARDSARPYVRFRSLAFEDPAEPILLGHADRLPGVQFADCRPANGKTRTILASAQPQAGDAEPERAQWTGWAWMCAGDLQELSPELTEEGLSDKLLAAQDAEAADATEAAMCLSVRTYRDYLETVAAILQKDFTGLIFGGNEVENGIWLSRNVSLHPTAHVEAPVYIAQDCRIGRGVSLGPAAVIGERCVVEDHSIVRNSVVMPRSYVGEGLELNDCIVDRNRLINASFGVEIPVEEFLLGSLGERELQKAVQRGLSRAFAAVLLLLLLPVLALVALGLKLCRKGPVCTCRDVVRLPAGQTPDQWQTFRYRTFAAAVHTDGDSPFSTFICRFLPGLIHVLKGELSFVGVPVRTPQEVEALPSDWRDLYLRSKPGLVTQAQAMVGPNASPDELYSAEVMYAVTACTGHDLRVFLKFLASLLLRGGTTAREPDAAKESPAT